MLVQMAAVMRLVRNYFEREKYEGTITIQNGLMRPALPSPYIVISGSSYYDGLHQNGVLPPDRPNETFEGVIWGLHPPSDFLALCEEIRTYNQKNPMGALQSESFGDYSYTRASAGNGTGGGWESAFSARLAPYRRMFTEVKA